MMFLFWICGVFFALFEVFFLLRMFEKRRTLLSNFPPLDTLIKETFQVH